jgi:hypothetical protein
MKPEIRAKKDKCTLVASVDHGKLRVLGVSDEPRRRFGGAGPRAAGVRDTGARHPEGCCARHPSPPDPYEDSETVVSDGSPAGNGMTSAGMALFGRPRSPSGRPTPPWLPLLRRDTRDVDRCKLGANGSPRETPCYFLRGAAVGVSIAAPMTASGSRTVSPAKARRGRTSFDS